MDVAHLDSVVEGLAASTGPDELASATVVGLGGGTALDTAKYVAWRTGRPLVQVPTITSVDAGFTDAIGIRDLGKVRYVGTVVPELVVLDLPLIRSAPPRLNRAGVGDVLSCHTGLFDWRLATEHGTTHPWHTGLAALGAVEQATGERQVNAIVDEVEEKMRLAGHKPARREGTREGRWILLDYIDIVVHVQHSDERSFYALDRLWQDCPLVEIDLEDVETDPEPT
jgi:ribosome silencing factor RsfS/YbeB/iojap